MIIVHEKYNKKKGGHLGKFWLCLRTVLHAYGFLALLMLSWHIFGYFTDSLVPARYLLLTSRLHLVLFMPLYYYVEYGKWPTRWREDFVKDCSA